MNIPEITEVKETLESLKKDGLLKSWELPYENILTRRSAAIFFLTPEEETTLPSVWDKLERYENFSYRLNAEKRLSDLEYRITFNEEEKEKNKNLENSNAN